MHLFQVSPFSYFKDQDHGTKGLWVSSFHKEANTGIVYASLSIGSKLISTASQSLAISNVRMELQVRRTHKINAAPSSQVGCQCDNQSNL